MTDQVAEGPFPTVSPRWRETLFVARICVAHFVSHYHMLLLPPLFLFVKAEYDVTFTELGFALAAFNLTTAVLQTPAGLLVDRIGARTLLIAGLVLSAGAYALAGWVNSFWLFVALFAVGGVANTVYHPADYSLLSERVSPERIGSVYSVHTFSGMAGNALAPVTLLAMQAIVGWRGAFMAAGLLALVAALWLTLQSDPPLRRTHHTTAGAPAAPTWRLLLDPAILRNLLFFTFMGLTGGGMTNYFVVASVAIHQTPAAIANTALTVMLSASALGVLGGGLLLRWTDRHVLIAVIGAIAGAILPLIIAFLSLDAALLWITVAIGGFITGVVLPSRDMIVRKVTPPGAFGTVFAFVSTGFSISGILTPLIMGPFMDHGMPTAVFIACAVFSLAGIPTLYSGSARRRALNAA